jgi:hypothetical protein
VRKIEAGKVLADILAVRGGVVADHEVIVPSADNNPHDYVV